MDFGYIILGAIVLALLFLLVKLFFRRSEENASVMLRVAAGTATTPGETNIGDSISQEVQWLLAQGKETEAILLMTEKAGMPADAARKVVQALQRIGAVGGMDLSITTNTVTVSQEDSAQIQRLIKQGEKIEAIKLLRERTGLGLKEAKDVVDKLG